MRTLKLTISYDGTGYSGFQRLTNRKGIQNIIEAKLSHLLKEPVQVAGSGRTDAGVHARCQVVSLETESRIPIDRVAIAMNSILPGDIRILLAEEAPSGFHARKDVCWKEYEYIVQHTPVPDPFSSHYVWQLKEKPGLEFLNEAARLLVGTHNFKGFRSSGSVESSPIKTIYYSAWEQQGENRFIYRIGGSGFVYHMVRNLVWSMIQIGLGRKEPDSIARELLAARGEFENSPAPPQGLYLAKVSYEPYVEKEPG